MKQFSMLKKASLGVLSALTLCSTAFAEPTDTVPVPAKLQMYGWKLVSAKVNLKDFCEKRKHESVDAKDAKAIVELDFKQGQLRHRLEIEALVSITVNKGADKIECEAIPSLEMDGLAGKPIGVVFGKYVGGSSNGIPFFNGVPSVYNQETAVKLSGINKIVANNFIGNANVELTLSYDADSTMRLTQDDPNVVQDWPQLLPLLDNLDLFTVLTAE